MGHITRFYISPGDIDWYNTVDEVVILGAIPLRSKCPWITELVCLFTTFCFQYNYSILSLKFQFNHLILYLKLKSMHDFTEGCNCIRICISVYFELKINLERHYHSSIRLIFSIFLLSLKAPSLESRWSGFPERILRKQEDPLRGRVGGEGDNKPKI